MFDLEKWQIASLAVAFATGATILYYMIFVAKKENKDNYTWHNSIGRVLDAADKTKAPEETITFGRPSKNYKVTETGKDDYVAPVSKTNKASVPVLEETQFLAGLDSIKDDLIVKKPKPVKTRANNESEKLKTQISKMQDKMSDLMDYKKEEEIINVEQTIEIKNLKETIAKLEKDLSKKAKVSATKAKPKPKTAKVETIEVSTKKASDNLKNLKSEVENMSKKKLEKVENLVGTLKKSTKKSTSDLDEFGSDLDDFMAELDKIKKR